MFLLSSKKNRGDNKSGSDNSTNTSYSPFKDSPLWGITSLNETNVEVGMGLFKKCTQYLEQNRGKLPSLFFNEHYLVAGFAEEGLFRRAGDEMELSRLQELTRNDPGTVFSLAAYHSLTARILCYSP